MTQYMWGDKETQFFYQLDPVTILDAVEHIGFETTGRCLTCNSMENRVYDVEIIVDESEIHTPSDAFRIVKFYRPGRWTKEQILEEHQFLLDLQGQEIPVIAPIERNGETLFKMEGVDIWFALFPKRGGRAPDEMNDSQLEQMGRLLARMHAVGRSRKAEHRIHITPESYGLQNLNFLLSSRSIPSHMERKYEALVKEICERAAPHFLHVHYQRIHGDCHLGNILWGSQGLQVFDFDDMLNGPPVQDIWLIVPGTEPEAIRQRNVLLDAYESMADFDWMSLKLIEPLRALRYIHFSAWIAKRWEDPAFKMAFPDFGNDLYWETQVNDLRIQLERLTHDHE